MLFPDPTFLRATNLLQVVIDADLGDKTAIAALVVSLFSLVIAGFNVRTSWKLRKIEEARSKREAPSLAVEVIDQYYRTSPQDCSFVFEVRVSNLSSTSNSIKEAQLVVALGGADGSDTFSTSPCSELDVELPVAVAQGESAIFRVVFVLERDFLREYPPRRYILRMVDAFGSITDHVATVLHEKR